MFPSLHSAPCWLYPQSRDKMAAIPAITLAPTMIRGRINFLLFFLFSVLETKKLSQKLLADFTWHLIGQNWVTCPLLNKALPGGVVSLQLIIDKPESPPGAGIGISIPLNTCMLEEDVDVWTQTHFCWKEEEKWVITLDGQPRVLASTAHCLASRGQYYLYY